MVYWYVLCYGLNTRQLVGSILKDIRPQRLKRNLQDSKREDSKVMNRVRALLNQQDVTIRAQDG